MTELETRLLEEVRNMNSYVSGIAKKQTTLTKQLNELAEQLEHLLSQRSLLDRTWIGSWVNEADVSNLNCPILANARF